MFTERTSVGLDVHARSVVATAIDTTTGELFKERLIPSNEVVLGWLDRLPGPVAVTYEACQAPTVDAVTDDHVPRRAPDDVLMPQAASRSPDANDHHDEIGSVVTS